MELRMAAGGGYSFHTFEIDALAHLVAVVTAHTRATGADVHPLDTLVNRVLAEHGIRSIKAFDDKVSKHLQDIEQEASAADLQSSQRRATAGSKPPMKLA